MSHLDTAAAASDDAHSTSYLVSGVRPSVVIRQTSLSHDVGDRVEGAAFAQLGVLADSDGDEATSATLRATSLDAINRSLLRFDGRGWKSDFPTLVSEALPSTALSVDGPDGSVSLVGVVALLIQWPSVSVTIAGQGVVAVVAPSSVAVVAGELQGAESESTAGSLSLRAAAEESEKPLTSRASWQGKLDRETVLIAGNVGFAMRWSADELQQFVRQRSMQSAASIASALAAPSVGASMSVIVSKLRHSETPAEVSASEEVSTSADPLTSPSDTRSDMQSSEQAVPASTVES